MKIQGKRQKKWVFPYSPVCTSVNHPHAVKLLAAPNCSLLLYSRNDVLGYRHQRHVLPAPMDIQISRPPSGLFSSYRHISVEKKLS